MTERREGKANNAKINGWKDNQEMGEKEKKKVNRDENGLAHNFKSIHLRLSQFICTFN